MIRSAEKSDVSQAIPVSRQKTARATEAVTCPMCDATGYISAAGIRIET
jgi:hypothetical protein